MTDGIFRLWLLIAQVALGVFFLGATWVCLPLIWGAPWIPIRARVAREMLRMADVQPGQKVVDLGAGDGRIVIASARLPGVQAIGVEIDPIRCLAANGLIALCGLRGTARVYWANMFDFDLSDADVVTLYLWRSTNRKLAPSLVERLRPGARVVSHHFAVANWIPVAVDPRERIYVYQIGNTGLDIRAMLAQKET